MKPKKPRKMAFGTRTIEADKKIPGWATIRSSVGAGMIIDTEDARRLGGWLTRFADWAEEKFK
jgi:hypothetical protein